MDILSVWRERPFGAWPMARLRPWPVVVALATGLLWGGPASAFSFTPLVVAAWWWSRTRQEAFAVALTYHFCAGRHLVEGAARYFEVNYLLALLCVLSGTSLIAAVWSLWWSACGRQEATWRAVARVLGLVLTTYLPGVGMFAIGNPLCAAGLWWPGAGWLGLVVMLAAFVGARRELGVGLMVVLGVVGVVRWQEHSRSPVAAVVTHAEPARGLFDFEQQWHVAMESMDAARAITSRVVVLPESAAGFWQVPMQTVWSPLKRQLEAEGRVAIVGATQERSDGRFDNIALVLGDDRVEPYRQRAPIPFAMWVPGGSRSFAAHWLGRGTLDVQGHRLGILICWEAALVWPVLQSVAEGAEVLVVMANVAWLPRGALGALRQATGGWSALFALPVAFAVNE